MRLSTGESLAGTVSLEDGIVRVEGEGPGASVTFPREKLVSLHPPPPAVSSKGNVALAAGRQTGNVERLAASLQGEFERKAEHDRVGLRFLLNYAEEDRETTCRSYFGAVQYDLFLPDGFTGISGSNFFRMPFEI